MACLFSAKRRAFVNNVFMADAVFGCIISTSKIMLQNEAVIVTLFIAYPQGSSYESRAWR